jgi:non-heme chloroperoxidase
MAQKSNPVVFIHGLWLHASSWGPWQELFGKAGYDAICSGLARRSGHR